MVDFSDEVYDVALSYAGEQRDYVSEVAKSLKRRGIKVVYDKDETAKMWGRNLVEFLQQAFEKGYIHCVMFISKEYKTKFYPAVEREPALCTNYSFYATVTTSIDTPVDITSGSSLISMASSVMVANQTHPVPVTIAIPPMTEILLLNSTLVFSSNNQQGVLRIQGAARIPVARVAIDICHAIGYRSHIHGEYQELHDALAEYSISRTGIKSSSEFDLAVLSSFDALLVVKPYFSNTSFFEGDEILAMRDFYLGGGGVFIGVSHHHNLTNVNRAIQWVGCNFAGNNTAWFGPLNMSSHVISQGIDEVDLSGMLLECPGNFTIVLADGPLISGHAFAACIDGPGRIFVAGFSDFYTPERFVVGTDSREMPLRIVFWLSRLL